ncbi:MAG TPA: DUF2795 domain-containing protein [Candidatus Saccharimonadia bacterium]|jgi:hypothetical protein|nr:DUF2795 domain-containing protein [Candidatus Saccharimonadia bacterium]
MTRGVGGEGRANIMQHLSGIDFPADKQAILEQARRSKGPDTQEVVNFLERIPDREYDGPQEILNEYSATEGGADMQARDATDDQAGAM